MCAIKPRHELGLLLLQCTEELGLLLLQCTEALCLLLLQRTHARREGLELPRYFREVALSTSDGDYKCAVQVRRRPRRRSQL
jgi:hypothetical protein